jgi:hypothetical protein
MKKLTLTDLRAQLAAFNTANSSVLFLRSVIKNSEDEYKKNLPYRDVGIERLTSSFSLDDIADIKHIMMCLEKPASFNSENDYLISVMRTPAKLRHLLEKFKIDASNSKRIIGDVFSLIENSNNGM